jgi:hypothetical protein
VTHRPREATALHTRLLKCALEIEDSRAYWAHAGVSSTAAAQNAFNNYWFGARSLARIETLLIDMRARYDAYPAAFRVLCGWPHMSPETRRVVCHWHVQLADPVYRRFAGRCLVDRRAGPRPEVTRDVVVGWVGQQNKDRWSTSTRIQFASKLLSSAYSAGLVTSNRDPRPLAEPRVPDEAIEYFMYLLREIEFEGTLLDNPYFRSCGLEGSEFESRLRGLSGLGFRKQGNLVDFGWRHESLLAWAEAHELRTPKMRHSEVVG